MTIKGLDKLQKALQDKQKLNSVKKVMMRNGAQMQQRSMRYANFKGHYEGNRFVPPTGTLRRSILLNMLDEGLTARMTVGMHYGPYVEYGTRYMNAQPFVRPAFNEQSAQLIRELRELTK